MYSLSLNAVSSSKHAYMKADSGATRTYIKPEHSSYIQDVKSLINGPEAILPDGSTIQASQQGNITFQHNVKLPSLIYPKLTSESLLSIGQLCDQGCIAKFSEKALHVFKNGELILSGQRNKVDGLWDVPFPTNNGMYYIKNKVLPKVNYIITRDKSKTELAQFLHATAFSPRISTFQKSINKGNFITWPGIDELSFKKLIGSPLATELGHLDQERKNLQSTKDKDTDEDFFPPQMKKCKDCIFSILSLTDKEITYTDQTGRFPYQSNTGMNYFFVCYDYDANAILVKTIPNRESKSIIDAWKTTFQRLHHQGNGMNKYILDNECSKDFQNTLQEHNVSFELVPPHQHRRNAAERAIRTFKNHFLAGLATCHKDFPIRQWDRLVDQAELTLNLLRNSRVNPNLSAWAYLFGNHDFNKVPLAPPGAKIVLHSKPTQRKSWAFHGETGFYVGPAPNHYRCVKCFIPKTQSIRVSDTVTFIPDIIPIPNATIDDHIRKTTDDLVHLLEKSPSLLSPKGIPSARQALLDIAKLLHTDRTPTLVPNKVDLTEQSLKSVHKSNIPVSSEGAKSEIPSTNIASSEGEHHNLPEKNKSHPFEDTRKITLSDINISNIPIHPSLYNKEKRQTSSSTSPPIAKRMQVKKIPKVQRNIDHLIKQFKNIPKSSINIRHKKPASKLPNHQASFSSYIPIPKSFRSTRQSYSHPMLLRKKYHKNQATKYKHKAAKHLLAQYLSNKVNHIFDQLGKKKSIDQLLKEDISRWGPSLSNEIGRLSQGIRNVEGNNAIIFIPKSKFQQIKK